MRVKVKPIQPTPALSGIDAKRIIAEVKKAPSKEAIDRNKRMLEKVRKVFKLYKIYSRTLKEFIDEKIHSILANNRWSFISYVLLCMQGQKALFLGEKSYVQRLLDCSFWWFADVVQCVTADVSGY